MLPDPFVSNNLEAATTGVVVNHQIRMISAARSMGSIVYESFFLFDRNTVITPIARWHPD